MKNEADNNAMIRQRFSTLLATASLLLSTTAVSMAVPASTLAAIPNVHVGRGTVANDLGTASSAQPTTVSPGAYVQFSTWAKNFDTSTVSQFFLTETTGRPINSASWSGSNGSGSCATTVPLNCSFGQLKPGQYINAVIVLQALPSGTSTPVNFVWSTVGIGHGDSFPVADIVGLNGGDDFSGRFLIISDSLTVANAAVGPGNSRSTAATVNASGIPVTVQDGLNYLPADAQNCIPTNTFDCTGFFGDWSSVNVANNNVFGSYFTVTITIDAASIPRGVTKNNLAIWHSYFNNATSSWDQEVISASCTDAGPPCMLLTTSKTTWVITIHTFHNGNYRTF
jgi:hypothetical protein